VKNGHKTFVTGLAFAPSSTAGQLVSGNSGFTLLSISIDNQLKLHQSPKPCMYTVILYAIKIVMSFLGFLKSYVQLSGEYSSM